MTIVEKARDKYKRYEQQRSRIIQAAIKVFGETNYDVGTMAMIAEEAGISEAMLYKHFDGKKELFVTCFHEIINELMDRYRECYERNRDDPLGYLEESAIAYLRYIKEPLSGPKYFIHLLSSTYDPELKKPLMDYFKASIDTVHKALEKAKAGGELGKDVDTELLAWDYVGQYYSLIVANEMGLKKMLDEDRLRAFVRSMFRS
jgi:AcrR family transcriptional regulator